MSGAKQILDTNFYLQFTQGVVQLTVPEKRLTMAARNLIASHPEVPATAPNYHISFFNADDLYDYAKSIAEKKDAQFLRTTKGTLLVYGAQTGVSQEPEFLIPYPLYKRYCTLAMLDSKAMDTLTSSVSVSSAFAFSPENENWALQFELIQHTEVPATLKEANFFFIGCRVVRTYGNPALAAFSDLENGSGIEEWHATVVTQVIAGQTQFTIHADGMGVLRLFQDPATHVWFIESASVKRCKVSSVYVIQNELPVESLLNRSAALVQLYQTPDPPKPGASTNAAEVFLKSPYCFHALVPAKTALEIASVLSSNVSVHARTLQPYVVVFPLATAAGEKKKFCAVVYKPNEAHLPQTLWSFNDNMLSCSTKRVTLCTEKDLADASASPSAYAELEKKIAIRVCMNMGAPLPPIELAPTVVDKPRATPPLVTQAVSSAQPPPQSAPKEKAKVVATARQQSPPPPPPPTPPQDPVHAQDDAENEQEEEEKEAQEEVEELPKLVLAQKRKDSGSAEDNAKKARVMPDLVCGTAAWLKKQLAGIIATKTVPLPATTDMSTLSVDVFSQIIHLDEALQSVQLTVVPIVDSAKKDHFTVEDGYTPAPPLSKMTENDMRALVAIARRCAKHQESEEAGTFKMVSILLHLICGKPLYASLQLEAACYAIEKTLDFPNKGKALFVLFPGERLVLLRPDALEAIFTGLAEHKGGTSYAPYTNLAHNLCGDAFLKLCKLRKTENGTEKVRKELEKYKLLSPITVKTIAEKFATWKYGE